eukprot:547940-Amorphochlora_amoeboformis.AAC.1
MLFICIVEVSDVFSVYPCAYLKQGGHFLMHYLEKFKGIYPKPEGVVAAGCSGLHDEGVTELGLTDDHRRELHIRDGDVEIFGHLGKPHHADVGDVKRSEVSLLS